MATALARAWVEAGLVSPDRIVASDPLDAARDAFAADRAFRTTANNLDVVAKSDVLLVAVKPQTINALLAEIRSSVTANHLIVSIAAGVTLKQLDAGLGERRRVIRVMPNTPCLVGASASAFAPGEKATAQDVALLDQLLNAVGKAFKVPEHLLDAVTGLSGSGPAYVYLIIEALSDGGVRVGLPREVATALAAQTVLGAAKMVLETQQHPAVLKDMVASPGGTTIAGLNTLERAGVRGALIDAVEAATRRATELGKM
jgi:pyrroline-5-carboxylate reductase